VTLSAKVAVGIVAVLAVMIAFLTLTHKVWFDSPTDIMARRMDILGQLIVGIGTAALAVVTWASVYETQQVVSGEDLRFRQSRMPMLCLFEVPEPIADQTATGFNIKVQNNGDGPAQDVRAALSATVTYGWNVQAVREEGGQKHTDPPVPGEVQEVVVPADFIFLSSYLRQNESATAYIRYVRPATPKGTTGQNVILGSFGWTLRSVRITYKDVFGEGFETHYNAGDKGISTRRFTVVRPPRYQSS
jgi:hypothetical protein